VSECVIIHDNMKFNMINEIAHWVPRDILFCPQRDILSSTGFRMEFRNSLKFEMVLSSHRKNIHISMLSEIIF